MKKRLTEFSYDKNQWVIRREKFDLFLFTNQKTNSKYCLNHNIVAFEQINDETFLMLEKVPNEEGYLFLNIVFNKEKILEKFRKKIKTFDFLTENSILFDKDCFTAVVYDIQHNSTYPRSIHSIVTQSTIRRVPCFCWSYKVKLIYSESNSEEYPKYIWVTYKLISFHTEHFIQVMVDTKTWQPLSPAYSTLQGKVDLSENRTLLDIIEEDNKHLEEIDKKICSTCLKDRLIAPTDLFSC